jgi:hypothetical protein
LPAASKTALAGQLIRLIAGRLAEREN